jgi:hypothetical protein
MLSNGNVPGSSALLKPPGLNVRKKVRKEE